jgi:hypothetical protein
MKNNYKSYECEACDYEEESQEHVLKCMEITRFQKEDNEEMKIINGNLKQKSWISKKT